MSEQAQSASSATPDCTVPLGEAEPARSRHAGRRSAVALADDLVVAGLADGSVVAFDRDSLDEQWCWPSDEAARSASVVAATPFAGGIAVGTRGSRGEIRLHDAESGTVRWRVEAADDVGEPTRDTRFFLPFVASLATDGRRLFAAARRYERGGADGDSSDDGSERSFESVVYALDPDGSVAWRHATDASPISLDVDGDGGEPSESGDGDRVAVAYNRCPGEFQHGLVVLDAETGATRWDWDPGTEGQRRVGDVSLVEDGAAVASHGDYRGYRLERGGAERWRVDLATPTEVGEETLYAYPNHVHATESGAVFVTGNTYPEEGRETDSLHPDEHSAIGVGTDGERRWSASVDGFASGVAACGEELAVPTAQHFRERDPAAHGVGVVATTSGPTAEYEADGIVAAAALDDDGLATIEQPVVYHDEGVERGRYALRVRVR